MAEFQCFMVSCSSAGHSSSLSRSQSRRGHSFCSPAVFTSSHLAHQQSPGARLACFTCPLGSGHLTCSTNFVCKSTIGDYSGQPASPACSARPVLLAHPAQLASSERSACASPASSVCPASPGRPSQNASGRSSHSSSLA